VGKIVALKNNLLKRELGIAGPNTLKEIEKRLRNLLQL
jgi:hypothetical protein